MGKAIFFDSAFHFSFLFLSSQEDMVDKWRLAMQEVVRCTTAVSANNSTNATPSDQDKNGNGSSNNGVGGGKSRLEAAVAAVRSADEYTR